MTPPTHISHSCTLKRKSNGNQVNFKTKGNSQFLANVESIFEINGTLRNELYKHGKCPIHIPREKTHNPLNGMVWYGIGNEYIHSGEAHL